jgi:hypothetical protein
VTETCSDSSGGATVQLSISLSVGTNSASGQVTETISDSAAGLSLTCNYGIAYVPT